MKKIWWLNPMWLFVILEIIVIMSYSMSNTQFVIEYKTPKYITINHIILYILVFIFFSIGYLISQRKKIIVNKKWKLNKNVMLSMTTLKKIYRILSFIYYLSYIIWFANFIRIHGFMAIFYSFSSTQMMKFMYIFKNNSGQIAGITSFTEVALVLVPLGEFIKSKNISKKEKKRLNINLLCIIIISIIRSILFSERLAIIAVVSTYFAIKVYLNYNEKKKILYILMPIFFVLSLFIVFGLFEYSRSWLTHYEKTGIYSNYIEFVYKRVIGYYSTAINTECMFVTKGKISIIPYWSIETIYELPIVGDVFNSLRGVDISILYKNLLYNFANEEFNNPGGMLALYKDFGIFFFFFEIVFGYFYGCCYKLFLNKNFYGMLFYPTFFYALVDLPRYYVFGSTRILVVFIVFILIKYFVKKNEYYEKL